MGVLVLTVLLSLVLVAIFIFLFLGTRKEDGFGGAERHSLLPFDDEDEAPRS
jgi:cbb3-type cytochrome oxidase subunit 3